MVKIHLSKVWHFPLFSGSDPLVDTVRYGEKITLLIQLRTESLLREKIFIVIPTILQVSVALHT